MKVFAICSVAVLLVAAVSADFFDDDFDDGWHGGVIGGPIGGVIGGPIGGVIGGPIGGPVVGPIVGHGGRLCNKHGVHQGGQGYIQGPPIYTSSHSYVQTQPMYKGGYVQATPYISSGFGSYPSGGYAQTSYIGGGMDYGHTGSYALGGTYGATSGSYVGGMQYDQSYGQQSGVVGGYY